MLLFKINVHTYSDFEYLKFFNTTTRKRASLLSLVCHGNSVLDNSAMDMCVLKTKLITFINGFFTDDFSIRAHYFSETVPCDIID